MPAMANGGLAGSSGIRPWESSQVITSSLCKSPTISRLCANLLLNNSDERPSSKGSSENSRPSSSRSQMRPGSRQSNRTPLRSFQSYGHDLNANSRPSSSGHRTQLQPARSMTSMSQYRDPNPRHSGRSPSPAFYSSQGRYSAYDDPDDDLNYPVESIGYGYDPPNFEGIGRVVSPGPPSPIGIPPSLRQTPSPLRWAMQDLMNSLDTMSPPLPRAPSPHDNYRHRIIHDYQQDDREGYPDDGWAPPDHHDNNSFPQTYESAQNMAPYMYPVDMRPPPLLNYVDKMQSKLDRFQNYQYSPQRESFDPNERYKEERSPSRLSANSTSRPRSAHSVDKPLPTSPIFQQPPVPPLHRHRETESITSHSTKHSIFSTTASDYSTAPSSVSNGSAGSAGAFARRKAQQRKQEQETTTSRTALSVLPKANSSNSALKRRKSYGSSLKKTIGKLLNTSPTKPPPGTVTDHGDKIIEWQNVRRDVNRANTPSAQERIEHRERLEMSEGLEVIRPIELLERIIEGDESANGSPILPDETFDIASRISHSMQLTC